MWKYTRTDPSLLWRETNTDACASLYSVGIFIYYFELFFISHIMRSRRLQKAELSGLLAYLVLQKQCEVFLLLHRNAFPIRARQHAWAFWGMRHQCRLARFWSTHLDSNITLASKQLRVPEEGEVSICEKDLEVISIRDGQWDKHIDKVRRIWVSVRPDHLASWTNLWRRMGN